MIVDSNRKQSDAPPESETEAAARETEPEAEKQEEEAGKMADVLHVEEARTGQRSRRSSGYASACSSPSFLAKKASGSDPATASAESDEMEKWRTSLYEVTLRWMFDTQPHDWVIFRLHILTDSPWFHSGDPSFPFQFEWGAVM